MAGKKGSGLFPSTMELASSKCVGELKVRSQKYGHLTWALKPLKGDSRDPQGYIWDAKNGYVRIQGLRAHTRGPWSQPCRAKGCRAESSTLYEL